MLDGKNFEDEFWEQGTLDHVVHALESIEAVLDRIESRLGDIHERLLDETPALTTSGIIASKPLDFTVAVAAALATGFAPSPWCYVALPIELLALYRLGLSPLTGAPRA